MGWRLLLLMALVLAAGFAPAPLPRRGRDDPATADLRRMQGLWVVVKYEHGGLDHLSQYREQICFRFQGKGMTCELDGEVRSRWVVELSPAPTPRALTKTGVDQKWLMNAIYRFEGQDLVICEAGANNGPRPTEFDSKGNRYLIVMRRR
jgi:uncharacterized protein (TIGR03067 family)